MFKILKGEKKSHPEKSWPWHMQETLRKEWETEKNIITSPYIAPGIKNNWIK